MIWQDLVLSAVSLLFSIALIPTLINKTSYIPRKSSILTAGGLTVMAYTFSTLTLDFTFFSTMVTGIIWWLIAVFRGIKK